MEYRVIETVLHTRKSLAGRALAFLFSGIMPRFQPHPLQFELEVILNQMARQGYFLVSQQIRAGSKGNSEAIIFIFAKDMVKRVENNLLKSPDEADWAELRTRHVTD